MGHWKPSRWKFEPVDMLSSSFSVREFGFICRYISTDAEETYISICSTAICSTSINVSRLPMEKAVRD
jgi:hypothetical protein